MSVPPDYKKVAPAALKEMLTDGGELALLDVREQGRFVLDGHLLFATTLPLGRLELTLTDVVPRRSARVELGDAGEGLAERAAERMTGIG